MYQCGFETCLACGRAQEPRKKVKQCHNDEKPDSIATCNHRQDFVTRRLNFCRFFFKARSKSNSEGRIHGSQSKTEVIQCVPGSNLEHQETTSFRWSGLPASCSESSWVANIVAHWCPNYLQDCESLRTFLWLMLVPRIRDVVMPKGGPDKYLEQKYDCQEILVFEPFQVAFMHDYRSQAQLGNMFSQNWFSSLTEFASLKLRHSWMELYFWNCAGEIAWVRPLDRHILWLGLKAPFWFQFLSHSILPSSHQSIKKGVATTWCW